ncbi:ArsR/SmtB family transcription factor [Oceaniglobus trochenteri]|uniref:ArsR/SmtB family transcription factor n=1 Tax=Oceaniglobus trochenteri TaxID=2763260 RepID=UPI001CFF872B|nr:metalloregulator ArsR/SmtB family transcription factor [Oceaniglobus trochenteri]
MTQTAPDLVEMADAAQQAAAAMRALSNPSRLLILCKLVEGPASVGTLEQALGLGQAYVSQQLARLRQDGVVGATRKGRTVVYALKDPRITPVLIALHSAYCPR